MLALLEEMENVKNSELLSMANGLEFRTLKEKKNRQLCPQNRQNPRTQRRQARRPGPRHGTTAVGPGRPEPSCGSWAATSARGTAWARPGKMAARCLPTKARRANGRLGTVNRPMGRGRGTRHGGLRPGPARWAVVPGRHGPLDMYSVRHRTRDPLVPSSRDETDRGCVMPPRRLPPSQLPAQINTISQAGRGELFSSNFSSQYPFPISSPVASFCVPFGSRVAIGHHITLAEDFIIPTSAEREREREREIAHGLWRQGRSLNMDILDHSEDEEEEQGQGRYYATTSSSSGRSRFRARRHKRRGPGGSHQHLLLMDCVGGSGGDGDAASEETVPLPDYERLSQSARLPDDDPPHDDDATNNPPPVAPLAPPEQKKTPAKLQGASPPHPPPPPPPPTQQQQKPAAWRLIEYVRSRHKAGGAGAAGAGCGAGSSDGDSKSSEDGDDGSEEGKKDKAKKKKRSSWLPDPERRWPVQGFY
ncbi:hypothetical protein HU200_047722 [Digitaria exilis]|uniref:Uncharacterized protein n=1 Tax=Digitaria exilis TaxID=1010633 RepID=A0A835EDK1_9POAL|nr:hypothetical protein HU200_047722 [Digitaria exilis]